MDNIETMLRAGLGKEGEVACLLDERREKGQVYLPRCI